MIGRLRGEILAKHPPVLLLDVHGVGYEVEAPMSTFYELPGIGETVTLHTHLVVREDAHGLYGFGREEDRVLFRNLLRVSGVGGKMALAILSGMTAEEFGHAVRAGDSTRPWTSCSSSPGSAQRARPWSPECGVSDRSPSSCHRDPGGSRPRPGCQRASSRSSSTRASRPTRAPRNGAPRGS